MASNRLYQYLVCLSFITTISGLDFCNKENYVCSQGHCCGNKKCCTYYYELWWFWVIWALVALLTFCCFYQQRRIKRARERRCELVLNEEDAVATSLPPLSSSANRSPSFFKPIFDPSKMLHLPTYEEVQDMPKDPPPYGILCQTTLDETALNSIGAPAYCDDSDSVRLLDNEETQFPPAYSIVPHSPSSS